MKKNSSLSCLILVILLPFILCFLSFVVSEILNVTFIKIAEYKASECHINFTVDYSITNNFVAIGISENTQGDIKYFNCSPIGGWEDLYKTDYMLFARIENEDEPFYLGVYEVTQAQWVNIMKNNPSFFADSKCLTRPVESIENIYEIIGYESGEDGFLEKIRDRTGISQIDLPTSKQWHLAFPDRFTIIDNSIQNYTLNGDCFSLPFRSFDNVIYKNFWERGKLIDCENLFLFWWIKGTKLNVKRVKSLSPTLTGTNKVGSYLPNVYGIYDMWGNVEELCYSKYYQKSNLIESNYFTSKGADWRAPVDFIYKYAYEYDEDHFSLWQVLTNPPNPTKGLRLALNINVLLPVEKYSPDNNPNY